MFNKGQHHSELAKLRIAAGTRYTGLASMRARHAREIAKKEQDLKVILAKIDVLERGGEVE
jgi:hypothetical protein